MNDLRLKIEFFNGEESTITETQMDSPQTT